MEDAIYDRYAMKSFMRLDVDQEQVPDATTLLQFRHLLEKHQIGEQIFSDLKERLDQAGLLMHGDSGYLGAPEQDAIKSNESFSKIKFRMNKRPSSLKINDCYKGENWDRSIERIKSSVRSNVEHPFLIVKRYFGYCKVAYKGIAKNMNRINLLFACANVLMCVRANRNLTPIVG